MLLTSHLNQGDMTDCQNCDLGMADRILYPAKKLKMNHFNELFDWELLMTILATSLLFYLITYGLRVSLIPDLWASK